MNTTADMVAMPPCPLDRSPSKAPKTNSTSTKQLECSRSQTVRNSTLLYSRQSSSVGTPSSIRSKHIPSQPIPMRSPCYFRLYHSPTIATALPCYHDLAACPGCHSATTTEACERHHLYVPDTLTPHQPQMHVPCHSSLHQTQINAPCSLIGVVSPRSHICACLPA